MFGLIPRRYLINILLLISLISSVRPSEYFFRFHLRCFIKPLYAETKRLKGCRVKAKVTNNSLAYFIDISLGLWYIVSLMNGRNSFSFKPILRPNCKCEVLKPRRRSKWFLQVVLPALKLKNNINTFLIKQNDFDTKR